MTNTLPRFNCRQIEVNGLQFNVVVEGEGPPVLLVHGVPDDHQVWRHQIPALVEAGYRVIAPDLRGFGETEVPVGKGAFQLPKLVSDLVGILDALGIGKVRLVSHDWGAACGWGLVIAHPSRVDRHVVMSVGHPEAYARGGLAQKLKGYYVLICASPIGEGFLKLFDWGMFRLITGDPPEFGHWRARMSRPGRLQAALGLYRDNLDMIFPKKYPRVLVPTVGVWSANDRFLARRQMMLSGQYVDADWRYVEVADASHWLQLDRPGEINALLLDCLG